MIQCAPPTASVSVITMAEGRAAIATSDEGGTLALRVREVQLLQASVEVLWWDSSQLYVATFIPTNINLSWFYPFFFFSDTGELSQVLWLLSHDLWTLEELLPDLSDHFGVQGKAPCGFFFPPTDFSLSKGWKELWNHFSVAQAESEDGLLLYCGENEHGRGDFTSLALVRGKLHYRWRNSDSCLGLDSRRLVNKTLKWC